MIAVLSVLELKIWVGFADNTVSGKHFADRKTLWRIVL